MAVDHVCRRLCEHILDLAQHLRRFGRRGDLHKLGGSDVLWADSKRTRARHAVASCPPPAPAAFMAANAELSAATSQTTQPSWPINSIASTPAPAAWSCPGPTQKPPSCLAVQGAGLANGLKHHAHQPLKCNMLQNIYMSLTQPARVQSDAACTACTARITCTTAPLTQVEAQRILARQRVLIPAADEKPAAINWRSSSLSQACAAGAVVPACSNKRAQAPPQRQAACPPTVPDYRFTAAWQAAAA